jgi:WXG100 family type VII secretion target
MSETLTRDEVNVVGQALVTPDRLNKAANDATTTGESIAANLNRLLTSIEASVASLKGGAGNAFQHTSHELGMELKQILEALNSMAVNVQGSNAAFGSTDADAANEITKVASMYTPGATPVVDALLK